MSDEIKPVVAEPDQRYWRRRANRRVRKERLTRSLRRWGAVSVALAILGIALFQAGAHAVERIKVRGGFAVEHLQVIGADRGGPESILQRLSPYVGRNIVDINLNEVTDVVARDPWVLHASAKRVLPGTLRITVTERHPAAVAMIGRTPYLVDTTGYVVGELQPGPFERLPVLVGLDGHDDEQLAAALLRGVRTLVHLHEATGSWVSEIAEMDLSRPDRIAVRTIERGPAILLDPGRVDRNVNHYLELRREIARRAGRLEYVDLRWQDRIAVMPAHRTYPELEGG
jgi:cell division protein FtsQ